VCVAEQIRLQELFTADADDRRTGSGHVERMPETQFPAPKTAAAQISGLAWTTAGVTGQTGSLLQGTAI